MNVLGSPAAWVTACAILFAAVGVVVTFRRKRSKSSVRDKAADTRRAIREMAAEQRRRGRGPIRGKGGGGVDKTAYDAAYGSDTSAGA